VRQHRASHAHNTFTLSACVSYTHRNACALPMRTVKESPHGPCIPVASLKPRFIYMLVRQLPLVPFAEVAMTPSARNSFDPESEITYDL
jgi:hypothetical protein